MTRDCLLQLAIVFDHALEDGFVLQQVSVRIFSTAIGTMRHGGCYTELLCCDFSNRSFHTYCGDLPNYIPNLRRGNGEGDALIEDYFGLGFSYSEVSSLLCWKLSLVGAFPLRSVYVALINIHNGRVYRHPLF